jgi:hypothetical protein
MNDTPHIELAAVYVQPPFPTWPPPSGGAPVTQVEQSPKLSPFPYGSTQSANISLSKHSQQKLTTKYTIKMPTAARKV